MRREEPALSRTRGAHRQIPPRLRRLRLKAGDLRKALGVRDDASSQGLVQIALRTGLDEPEIQKSRQLGAAGSPPLPQDQLLATPTTVESAAAVEPTAAMESATTVNGVPMEATAACNVSVSSVAVSDVAVSNIATSVSAAIAPRATPSRVTDPRATTPSVCPSPVSEPSRTMEPRACSYEQTSDKPVWTVISIRSAGVGIVAVIAIGAHWSRTYGNTDRSHADPNAHLRL